MYFMLFLCLLFTPDWNEGCDFFSVFANSAGLATVKRPTSERWRWQRGSIRHISYILQMSLSLLNYSYSLCIDVSISLKGNWVWWLVWMNIEMFPIFLPPFLLEDFDRFQSFVPFCKNFISCLHRKKLKTYWSLFQFSVKIGKYRKQAYWKFSLMHWLNIGLVWQKNGAVSFITSFTKSRGHCFVRCYHQLLFNWETLWRWHWLATQPPYCIPNWINHQSIFTIIRANHSWIDSIERGGYQPLHLDIIHGTSIPFMK